VQWFRSTPKISAGCGSACGFLLSVFNIYINLPWRCFGWVSIIKQILVTQIRKYLTFWTNGKKCIKMFLTKYFVRHACDKVSDLTNKNWYNAMKRKQKLTLWRSCSGKGAIVVSGFHKLVYFLKYPQKIHITIAIAYEWQNRVIKFGNFGQPGIFVRIMRCSFWKTKRNHCI